MNRLNLACAGFAFLSIAGSLSGCTDVSKDAQTFSATFGIPVKVSASNDDACAAGQLQSFYNEYNQLSPAAGNALIAAIRTKYTQGAVIEPTTGATVDGGTVVELWLIPETAPASSKGASAPIARAR